MDEVLAEMDTARTGRDAATLHAEVAITAGAGRASEANSRFWQGVRFQPMIISPQFAAFRILDETTRFTEAPPSLITNCA